MMALDGSAKSTVDSVRRPMIANMQIPLPSVAEQKSIVRLLDSQTAQIDALIASQEQLIGLIVERRRALAEVAVARMRTEGLRLKHFVRSVVQGWSPLCLGWSADGINTWAVLRAGAANGGVFRPFENKELPSEQAPRPNLTVKTGQLVVSRANTRDLVGSAAVVGRDYPRLMLCDKLYAFTLDRTLAEPNFVALVLGSRRWRDLIEMEATGASHSMLNITQFDIMNLPMNLPPLDEQQRVLADLQNESARIAKLIAGAEDLVVLAKERRAALITAAVTGRIDVSKAA